MRILKVAPLDIPCEKEISGTLPSMQAVVGGLIQAVYPFEDPTVALICHEEGKLIGLPPNRVLYGEDGQIYDIIYGTFFLCAAKADDENFSSLSPEQIQRYTELFQRCEIFL